MPTIQEMTDELYAEALDTRPDGHGLFRYAAQMICDLVPKDQGRDFLLEMNAYGERLLALHERLQEEEDTKC